jgi:hypothetical protein
MSESAFPFGAPAESETLVTEEDAADSRKPLLLVGGLVGALALAAGAFLLLGGGGEEEAYDLGLPAPSSAAPAPVVEEAPLAVVPAATSEVVGRNPFQARYVEPQAAPASEGSSDAPGETPVSEPLPLPQPVQQPVQIVVQPDPSATQAPAEYPITLKKVEPTGPSGVTYTWVIGGKDVEVLQAQRFGVYGELVVLALETTDEGPKAVLQVGDAPPIRVKVAETVNVL